MIDDEVDEFLEHFGTKGMKWGVRNQRTTSDEKPKMSAKKKVLIGVAVAGTAAAALIIAKKSGVSVSSIRGSASTIRGGREAKRIAARNKAVRASQLAKTTKLVKASLTPKSEMDAIIARQQGIIKSANADLASRYNKLDTPFGKRSYLKEWA
jgi:gas vesicle protein